MACRMASASGLVSPYKYKEEGSFSRQTINVLGGGGSGVGVTTLTAAVGVGPSVIGTSTSSGTLHEASKMAKAASPAQHDLFMTILHSTTDDGPRTTIRMPGLPRPIHSWEVPRS